MKVVRILFPLLLLACAVRRPGASPDISPKVRGMLSVGALTALIDAREVELLSLFPSSREEDAELWEERGHGKLPQIGGYAVIGSTTAQGEIRALALQAVFDGIDENGGAVAECFEPRHGIRVVHGGHRYEFVICFECLQIRVYEDDKQVESVLTSESPRGVFNAILRSRRVPLPDQ